jgi:hypothetical protein
MEVGGQRHAPAALPLGKRPATQFTKRWVGPRTGQDIYEKFSLHPPPPTGIRSPDHPARSDSLYRLRYPGQIFW